MTVLAGGSYPIVQLLGWTLVHFLWQGVAVGIAFASARALLASSNCRARYALGVGAMAALAALPVATFAFLYAHADASGVGVLTASTVAKAAASVQATAAAGTDSVLTLLMPWLVGGWCIGVVLMLARAGRQMLRLARIARRFSAAMQELDGVFETLRRRFGVAASVRVKVSSLIDTPMLIGWIKPIVLLPTAVAIGFPRAELELVLAHELGHLRRFDHLVNLAQMIVETLLFYHPVVHWISREVRDQRELCCDQLVVERMSADARRYARALASLEEARYSSRLALAASGGELVERVRRLVGAPSDGAVEWRARSGLAPIALLALFLAMSAALLRRVDAPTLLIGPIALEWPTRPSLDVNPLFAGLALMPRHLRLVPMELPPRLPKSVPERATTTIEPTDARPSTPATAAIPATVAPSARALVPSVLPAPIPAPTAIAAPSTAPKTPIGVEHPQSVPRAAAAATRLVSLHTVTPQFPAWSRAENGRVDVSFTIGADGSVRDVEATGNTPSAFDAAAKAAVRQWRFDPATVADRGERFTQSFVFEAARRGRRLDENCVRVTGSMICRSPADADAMVRMGAQPNG